VGDGQGECRGGSGEECRGYWMLRVMDKGEPVVGSAGGDKVQNIDGRSSVVAGGEEWATIGGGDGQSLLDEIG